MPESSDDVPSGRKEWTFAGEKVLPPITHKVEDA
jgi:hypothetical protein